MNNKSSPAMIPFTREQTDEQYNPILWSRRLPPDDLLPAHVEFTTTRSEAYRKSLGSHFGQTAFGTGEIAGAMDVYRPAHVAENAPVVIYIHGGWWQWFSKEQFGYLAEPFNVQGYAVVMPAYRLAQDWNNGAPMESIQRQMESAVAAVLEDAAARGVPAVHVVGHSAGGHLAALLHRTDWTALGVSATAQKKLRAVFSLAGLFDIRPLVDSYVNDAIGMSMAAAERVSPQLLPSPEGPRPPLHLILPEYDTPEFFRQTKEYQEKLLRAGLACRLHVVPERDHLDLIERLPDDGDPLARTLFDAMARAEVADTSRSWITSFNAGDVTSCVRGYTENARMHAKPVGEFVGRAAIQKFWSDFLKSTGATDLEYDNVRIDVEGPGRVRLAADWRMNVGRGIITKELWIQEVDGGWRLEEDHFEVQEQW